jgi:hypothetical protein
MADSASTNCGGVHWWRQPDYAGLLLRHGQVEHLIIQFDFLVQVERDARAEYSIPGASKSVMSPSNSAIRQPGYADIVSLATREIWEIKPQHLIDQAFDEAGYYVAKAIASCGAGWRKGNSYHTSVWANETYGPDVVYMTQGSGQKWELIAKQGRFGTVGYRWSRNGRPVDALPKDIAWYVRDAVVSDYFTGTGKPSALVGAPSANDIPPVKFKTPVLASSDLLPALEKYRISINRAIWTTCAQTIPDGSTVAMLLDRRFVDALLGPSLVNQRIQQMQVARADPVIVAYRTALEAILLGNSVVGFAVGAWYLLPLVVEGAAIVGDAIVVVCSAAEVAALRLATEGLIGTLTAGIRATQVLRTPVAAGAALVMFAVPKVSDLDPSIPVGFDISMPRYVIRKPGERAPSVGDRTTVAGLDFLVVGVARTSSGD